MHLLLDTHILLWTLLDDPKLSAHSRHLILKAETVYVSSVSIFEIVIKSNLRKLEVEVKNILEAIPQIGFLELSMTVQHAAAIHDLPLHHKDPFDRLLIAQSLSESLTFLTADRTLKAYTPWVLMN